MADADAMRGAVRHAAASPTLHGLLAQAAGAGAAAAAVWLLAGFAWALLLTGVVVAAWGLLREGELI